MVAGGGRWPAAEGTGAEEERRTWVCALRILCISQGPSCNLGLYCALLCNIIPFRLQKKIKNESTSVVELTSQAAVIFYVHTYGVYIRN